MKTALIIFLFILLYGAITRFWGVMIGNLAGLPGALIARDAISRKVPRYILGVIVSSLGQAYAFLSLMLYVINWTRVHAPPSGFLKYLVWFFCAAATVGAVQKMQSDAQKEAKGDTDAYLNPQIQALLITEVVCFFGFFAFVFFPKLSEPLWSWVNRIGFPF